MSAALNDGDADRGGGSAGHGRQARFEVPGATRPGIYWLRLSQAGRSAAARVAVLR